MSDDIFIDVSDNEQLPRPYISHSNCYFRAWLNHLSSRTKDNGQLLDNSFGDLVVSSNPSNTIYALEQQYRQYFNNGDSESLRLCSETLSNLVYKPKVLSQLAQNGPFLELLTDMLDGQNDQLVVAISELICHLSMDLQLDCSLISNSRLFKSMINVGKAAKKLEKEIVLVAVLKAMDYWTLVSVDNRKHILDIDGALELVTSCLTLINRDRKWWERSSTCRRVVHNFVHFSQSRAILTSLFYIFCPSILYKLWDNCFSSYDPRVPFGSGKNCSIIRDYLRSSLPVAIKDGFLKFQDSFILDNKAIYDLAVKYRPVRFPPKILLDDPLIKFLLIPRTRKRFSWKNGPADYYTEYEIFSPNLPSRKSSLTTVQHASRLLMSLSTDRFHSHESSMTHFRQHNIASLLGEKHVDFRSLPVAMPIPERVLLQENACQTLVNVLDNEPEVRAGSEEWKYLLDLEGAYNCRKLTKEDTIPEVFQKLAALRTCHRTRTDRILGCIGEIVNCVFWCSLLIAYIYLVKCLVEGRIALYKYVHARDDAVAGTGTGSGPEKPRWERFGEFWRKVWVEDAYFISSAGSGIIGGFIGFSIPAYIDYTKLHSQRRQFTTVIMFHRV